MYTCDGSIGDLDGSCSGQLSRFTPEEDEDFCYVRSYLETEGKVCLSEKPLEGLKCFDKAFKSLELPKERYNEMCSSIVTGIKYKYFSDTNNPKHVQIPSDNKLISCENNEPGVCEFTNQNVPEASSNVVVVGDN